MILPAIFAGQVDDNGDGAVYLSNLMDPVRIRCSVIDGVSVDTRIFWERYNGNGNHGRCSDLIMIPIN